MLRRISLAALMVALASIATPAMAQPTNGVTSGIATDAQMLALLKLDLEPALITRLRSIAHIHGLPLDARSVTDELMTMEGK